MAKTKLSPYDKVRFVVMLIVIAVLGYKYDAHHRVANLFGPDHVVLKDAIDSGDITLRARGKGKVNGYAVRGLLTNTTPRAKQISTTLMEPLYFMNSDFNAQDMLVTRVHSALNVNVRGRRLGNYLDIPEKGSVLVEFVAYCLEQHKETPDRSDSFRISPRPLPTWIRSITENLKRYRSGNPRADVFDGMQAAIWDRQGVDFDEVVRIDVDEDDQRIANALLR